MHNKPGMQHFQSVCLPLQFLHPFLPIDLPLSFSFMTNSLSFSPFPHPLFSHSPFFPPSIYFVLSFSPSVFQPPPPPLPLNTLPLSSDVAMQHSVSPPPSVLCVGHEQSNADLLATI